MPHVPSFRLARRLSGALAAGLLLGACAPAAQNLGDLVTALATETDYSGVVLLADGDSVTLHTFGYENIETGAETQEDTRYQLGSISKWISTLVVFQLVDDGVLDLDTPIGAYLTGVAEETGRRVTLHHLITHTSGVPNDLVAAFRSDPTVLDVPLSQDAAAARYASGDLAFAPGERFDYSHSNWILVQAVLERVTGQPFAALVDEHLVGPLGLTGTSVVTGGAFDAERLAVGYASVDPVERADARFQGFLGATGGMVSTAPDLLAILDALYGGDLLSQASRARLDRVVVEDEWYASGGRVRTLDLGRGEEVVAWHSGSNGPSKSRMSRAVGSGLTVITLSNTGADSDATVAFAERALEMMATR